MRPTLRERLRFWCDPTSTRWLRRALWTYASAAILMSIIDQIGNTHYRQIDDALHGHQHWVFWTLLALAPAICGWRVPSARLAALGAPIYAAAMLGADFAGWALKLSSDEALDDYGILVPMLMFPLFFAVALPSALAAALARQLLRPLPLSPAKGTCRCGYNLTGLAPGSPCPECGRPAVPLAA